MVTKTVLVVGTDTHEPITAGDKIDVSVVPISATAGNLISAASDGLLATMAASVIAATFKDCEGNNQVAGASIPTCAEMTAAITGAIGSMPQDNFLKSVRYDPVAHTLTFEMESGGPYTVNLSDLLPVKVKADGGLTGDGTVTTPLAIDMTAGTLPAPTIGTSLPTKIIGGRTMLLGEPDGVFEWGGKLIPFYNAAP